MKKDYDYLIVGAGLFGAVFAYQASRKGKKCLVIDKRSHTGGNIYCDNRDGINVHYYGAHIFHTDNREVWDFANRFVRFNNFVNSPLAYYKGKIYNLPFNMNTFYQLWGVVTPHEAKEKLSDELAEYEYIKEPKNLEEQALKLCGKEIYNTFIKGYTEKQWGCEASALPAFVIKRIPFRFVYDNNYFNDPYQGIPIGGYNPLIEALLADSEVRLNTDYFDNREYFDSIADKTLYTGCLDRFFDYEFGDLEYRSLRFIHKNIDMDDFQGNAVVNYNEFTIPYTRIIEHKHFEFGKQPFTVVTYEYPDSYDRNKDKDDPYYPINTDINLKKVRLYLEKAGQTDNLLLGGRLGLYKYLDMDDTIAEALELSKKEFPE